MCLGVPGQVLAIDNANPDFPMGRVSFGGVVQDVCLAYTPDTQVGDYVIVHVGFAISRLDEAEAKQTLEYLEQIEALANEPSSPSSR